MMCFDASQTKLFWSTCRHLRHKNLVQLVGLVFLGSFVQCIVMELMGKVCEISAKQWSGSSWIVMLCLLITGVAAKVPHFERSFCHLPGRTLALRKVPDVHLIFSVSPPPPQIFFYVVAICYGTHWKPKKSSSPHLRGRLRSITFICTKKYSLIYGSAEHCVLHTMIHSTKTLRSSSEYARLKLATLFQVVIGSDSKHAARRVSITPCILCRYFWAVRLMGLQTPPWTHPPSAPWEIYVDSIVVMYYNITLCTLRCSFQNVWCCD